MKSQFTATCCSSITSSSTGAVVSTTGYATCDDYDYTTITDATTYTYILGVFTHGNNTGAYCGSNTITVYDHDDPNPDYENDWFYAVDLNGYGWNAEQIINYNTFEGTPIISYFIFTSAGSEPMNPLGGGYIDVYPNYYGSTNATEYQKIHYNVSNIGRTDYITWTNLSVSSSTDNFSRQISDLDPAGTGYFTISGSSDTAATIPYSLKWENSTKTTINAIYNTNWHFSTSSVDDILSIIGTSSASTTVNFNFWGNYSVGSCDLTGSWWNDLMCFSTRLVLAVPLKLVAWVATGMGNAITYIASNLFPFNIPVQFVNCWTDSATDSLPASLEMFAPDGSGDLTWTIPSALAGATSSIVVWGPSMTDGDTTADGFFAGVRAFSTYIQWFGFIMSLWVLGKRIYDEIYKTDDQEIIS